MKTIRVGSTPLQIQGENPSCNHCKKRIEQNEPISAHISGKKAMHIFHKICLERRAERENKSNCPSCPSSNNLELINAPGISPENHINTLFGAMSGAFQITLFKKFVPLHETVQIGHRSGQIPLHNAFTQAPFSIVSLVAIPIIATIFSFGVGYNLPRHSAKVLTVFIISTAVTYALRSCMEEKDIYVKLQIDLR